MPHQNRITSPTSVASVPTIAPIPWYHSLLQKFKSHEYITVLYDNAPFRYVFLSAIISRMGDFLTSIALSTRLEVETEGTSYNGLVLSLLVVAIILPSVIFSPSAGVVADLMDKRLVMMSTDIIRSVVVLFFLLVEGNTPLLLLVLFITESFAAFFNPSKEGLIPSIVPYSELDIANSLDAFMWLSCSFLGSMFGGILMVLFGSRVCYVLDSLTYLVSATFVVLLILAMRRRRQKGLNDDGTPKNASTDGMELLEDEMEIEQELEEMEHEEKRSDSEAAEEASSTSEKQTHPLPSMSPDSPDKTSQDGDSSTNDHPKTTLPDEKSTNPEPSTIASNRVDNEASFSNNTISDPLTLSTDQLPQEDDLSNIDLETPIAEGPPATVLRNFSFSERIVYYTKMAPLEFKKQVRGYVYGFIFLLTNPFILTVALAKALQAAIWGVVDIYIIIHSNGKYKIADNPSIFMSLTRALMGLTSGMSPILLERIVRPKSALAMRRVISFSWIIMATGMLITFAGSFMGYYGLFFFVGGASTMAFGGGLVWVYSTTILQKSSPENYVGRVMAFDMGFAASLFECLFAVLTGFLIDFTNLSSQTIMCMLTVFTWFVTAGWIYHYFHYRKIPERYTPRWLFEDMRFSGLNEEQSRKLQKELHGIAEENWTRDPDMEELVKHAQENESMDGPEEGAAV